MGCLACEWNRKNITDLAFCPSCGNDASLVDYASYAPPTFEAVDKPVDNFFKI